MARSDSLFKLIKSMTPSEKRYFKVFTGGGDGKEGHKYHLLFEAIDEQATRSESYQELAILKALKGKLNEDNISFEKNYLYQSIMKSLRYFQSELSPHARLKELFIDIYILYERGLHQDTLKFIRKAKKIAQKNDYNLDYLELSLLERRIKRQTARKEAGKLIRALQEDCRQKLQHINSQFKILDLYEEVFINIRNQNITEEALSSLGQKIKKELGPEGATSYSSFEEQMYYHLTYSMFYLFSKNASQRMEHLKSLLEYFENHSYLLDDNQYQERYLSCLNNYVNHCYLHQSGEELKEQIDKLQELSPRSRSLQIQLKQYLYYSKMLYYFKRIINAFKKAIQSGDPSILAHLYKDLKESQGYEEIQYWLEKNI